MEQAIDFTQLFAAVQAKKAQLKTSPISEGKEDFASIFKALSAGKSGKTLSDSAFMVKASGSEADAPDYGMAVIDYLKKIMAAKCSSSFGESTMDTGDLASFEALLVKAGLNTEKASSVISAITSKAKNGSVSLMEVFAGLDMLEDADFSKKDFFMSASDFENLLAKAGLSDEDIKNIAESFADGEKGVNIEKFFAALKNICAGSKVSGSSSDFRAILVTAGIDEENITNIEKNRIALSNLAATLKNSSKAASDEGNTKNIPENVDGYEKGTALSNPAATLKNSSKAVSGEGTGINILQLSTVFKNIDKTDDDVAEKNFQNIFTGKNGHQVKTIDSEEKNNAGNLVALFEQLETASACNQASSINDLIKKTVDLVKSPAVFTDPAGASRMMFARIMETDENQAASNQIAGKKTDIKSFAASKNTKNPEETLFKNSIAEKNLEVFKSETFAEDLNESKIAGFSSKTDKAGEQFEMAAKIFEAASGREIPVSEKTAQSAPSLPGYVSNQAAKGIVRAVNSNEKEIVIQIKPPELGRMQIKIETTDSGMNVQILAEKSIASDILGSNKADLAAYLAESGIKVNKLDIQLAFNFDQAMSSYKENAHQESGKRRNRRDSEDEAAREKSADNLEETIVIDDRVSLTA